MSQSRVQLNYWAILAAALATFFLEAVWYTAFQKPWLQGIASTREQLMNSGVSPALPYLTAFAMAAIIAAAISCTVQLTGPQTAVRGIRVGAAVWASFVFTTFATEYAFEVKPGLFGINAGFWLIGMMLTGAIVGGWRRKTPSGLRAVVTESRATTASK
ncbi:DUF1761 domain-containing protein [Occallatibacter riparius]|uniref:DUF1761 domain-containing protein n=1 Tax=Occallatibacter riparius TaxID=1002689 RepID=A0A9J7BX03_9BACT|nr:DUF1761 domain-containing protein [Occallatibacter riparius]UWZ85422.1 DUF1761 domain-containing protein [Occallatibacter riparius]